MSPEALQQKLRRILNTSTIEVKQDRAWAARHRMHPHAYQVWDRGTKSGTPYVVCVLQRGGVPCEPGEAFFANLWRSQADQIHKGRPGWADNIASDMEYAQDQVELRKAQARRQKYRDMRDQVFHMFGHGRHWALNRSVMPQGQ